MRRQEVQDNLRMQDELLADAEGNFFYFNLILSLIFYMYLNIYFKI